MKTILSGFVFILFFAGCTSLNHSKNNIEAKEQLIQKANNGNIQAMVKLNEYYKFPLTKEGLYYFNKWYKTIDKNDNPKDINDMGHIYYKYKDMFINGEIRALKLYELSSSLGNLDSDIAQMDILIDSYKREESEKLENRILPLLNKEQLVQLYKVYHGTYYSKNKYKIINQMNEKGYELPFDYTLDEIKRLYFRTSTIDELNALIDETIKKKNPKNIYQLAHHLKNVQGKQNKALYIYKKLIELDPSNDKIYEDMAGLYSIMAYRGDRKNRKKNNELTLEYYERASLLGNENASERLLALYSKNIGEFFAFKNRLIKTEEGQLILAKYYYEKRLYIKANQLFEKLAKNGNQEAILYLALLIQPKNNFEPDIYITSQKWQKVLISLNDPILENKYITGLLKHSYKKSYKETFSKYVEKNSKKINILTLRKLASRFNYKAQGKALYYYKIAAYSGDKESINDLANFYLYNTKYNDFNKAVETYSILVKEGDISTTKKLAKLYMNPPRFLKEYIDVKKGLEYYEKLANKGDIYSIRKLKEAYLCKSCTKGDVVDYKKGFKYLKKLEHLNKGTDLADIAWFYSIGKGVKKDSLKAKEYYEKAKKQGINSTNYYLANLYYDNKDSLPRPIYIDHQKALEYLKEGAKHHHGESINLLGLFYQNGYGVKKDLEKAASYYKQIANFHPKAAYHLGIYYINKKDYRNAKKYFIYSANKKNVKSMIHLGIIYEKGLVGEINIKKAIHAYEQAYKQNKNKDAAYSLGLIYHYGKGNIKKDLKKAKFWYKKSKSKRAKKELVLLDTKK